MRKKNTNLISRNVIANGVKQSRGFTFNRLLRACALAMLLLVFGAASTAFAQSGQTGPLTWVLEDGTLTISGEGEMPDYIYPPAVPWFAYQESIYTVIMEPGITAIGNFAFWQCQSLSSVSIPDGVTSIGKSAFRTCSSLTSITIPNGVKTIGEEAFCYCSLTSIIIPNSVTTIGNFAFSGASLTSITLPNSITTISEGCFDSCKNLTSITLPNTIKTIGRQAFCFCMNLPSITIPNSVTTIEDGAFSSCYGLTSIVIPNSVTKIGIGAFLLCSKLTSVTLSNSITAIESHTFWYCENLTSITIPDGVTKIGVVAFNTCVSLPSINIPSSVTTIEYSAFTWCQSLTSITIPNSVTSIGSQAFAVCTNLTSIEVESGNNHYVSEDGVLFDKSKTTLVSYPAGKTASTFVLPGNVTKIVNGALSACPNLVSIEIENENTPFTSEDGVLFNKDKTVLICCPGGKAGDYFTPNSVTTIENDAFYYCKNLTSITIPNKVTSIGERAFSHCTSLTSIILPKSVKKINYAAFYYSNNLTSITNLNTKPVTITSTDFFSVSPICTLTVPTSAVSAYQGAAEWNQFKIVGGGILVNPVANNGKYGYTIGDGLYQEDEIAEVTAVAYEGYEFVKWTKNGVEVSTDNPYSFFVTEDVELVAHFEAEVGIVETDNYPSLRIYPNPASGAITISAAAEIEQLQIYDIVGRLIHSQTPTNKDVVFDTGVLAKGVYLVRALLRDGAVQTGKVVIQ